MRLVAAAAACLVACGAAGSERVLLPAPRRPEAPQRTFDADPLRLWLSLPVHGGLVAAATCVNFAPAADGGPTGGTLRLRGVPPDATILDAWLYWSVLSDAPAVPSGVPTLDGRRLAVIPIATMDRSPCISGTSRTGIFRADARAVVTGDGDYRLGGLVGSGTIDGEMTEGATLFVIWCGPSGEDTLVLIWEGVDVTRVDTSPTFSQRLTGFEAASVAPVHALLALAAGNGQSRPPPEDDIDPLVFEGVDLDARDPTILSGGACLPEGGLYDLTAVDVSGLLAPGSTSATLSVTAVGDCHSIGAVALAVQAESGSLVLEPSALDRNPAAPPLLVEKSASGLDIRWEDIGSPEYRLYEGTIGRWYDHGRTPGGCALPAARATVPIPAGNRYYLAVAGECFMESTTGRDSFGRRRPSAQEASGNACP